MASPVSTNRTRSTDPLPGASRMPRATPLLVSLWQSETEALHQAERFSRNWLKRRQDAVQSTLSAGMRLMTEGLTDPLSGARVLGDWQAASLRRLSEDAQEWTALVKACEGQFRASESTPDGETPDATQTQTPAQATPAETGPT